MARTRSNFVGYLISCCLVTLLASCAATHEAGPGCNVNQEALKKFQSDMRSAIELNKIYPAEAIAERVQGSVEMSFDYTKGDKAFNAHVVKSSGSIYLDAAALVSLMRADLPPKPCGLEDIDHFVFIEQFSF